MIRDTSDKAWINDGGRERSEEVEDAGEEGFGRVLDVLGGWAGKTTGRETWV